MSSEPAATAPPLKRRLSSAASDDDADEPTAAATPPAAPGSAAQPSDTAPKRKKARRQLLLAEASGHQQPPRWSDFPPAQRCFSDGLALAFSFLSLFELILAARTCRSWRDAAIKANISGVEVRHPLVWPGAGEVRACSRLQSLVASPFRRHVHALTDSVTSTTNRTPSRQHPHPTWMLSDLQLLQQLSKLRHISGMDIELYSFRTELSMTDATQPFTFPPLLESVELHLFSNTSRLEEGAEDLLTELEQRLVLRALRPCHSLTELSITLHPHSRLDVDSLQELVHLQALTLDISQACSDSGDEWCMFDEQQTRVAAQLSNLRRLTLRECETTKHFEADDPFAPRWLHWLCTAPHQLQRLQELDLSQQHLQLEHMQLLQRLPALTAVEPACMYPSAIPMLKTFAAHLQRLKVIFVFLHEGEEADPEIIEFGYARGSWLVPHLVPCAALTELTLINCILDEADAAALCQALTQLRVLELKNVGWPNFESLRHLPLLESFCLQQSQVYPLHLDVAHFRPLQRLRNLTLIGVHLLTEAAVGVVDALRPPSALLPGLVHFRIWP